jgi:hypothetical protein
MHEPPMVSSLEIYELHIDGLALAYSRRMHVKLCRPAARPPNSNDIGCTACQDPDHAKLVKDTRAVLSPDEEVPTFF